MTINKHRLEGRVAIVTGAGKGLGRAWALQLASLGARLIVNNRGATDQPGGSSADAVVNEIRAQGGEAFANHLSVEQSGAGEQLVDEALDHFGQLDIVIANAGIDIARSFHKLEADDFEQVVAINFLAASRLLHAAWPRLLESSCPRALLASSTAGLYGNHGQAAYASSKAALLGLMKTLAIEGASRGVCINAIAPYAYTQMTGSAFPAELVEQFAPEATARLVGWLVSEQCNITGKTLIVGADHLRIAQTLETETVPLGDDPQQAVESLLGAPFRSTPPDTAIAEFRDFVVSVRE